jgi:hypothetical protein
MPQRFQPAGEVVSPAMPRTVERVTLTEAARRLGTSRQNLTNLRRRHPAGFPKHDESVVGVKVYRFDALMAWWLERKADQS